MIVTKSYSFYNDNLNIGKYDLLYKKAVELRDFKNQISEIVCSDFSTFANMSNFDWINHFRTRLPNCNNQDISHAISDVFVAYGNKIQQFQQNTSLKVQSKIQVAYYKRNGKTFKKGDVKTYEVKMKSTKLTKLMTYLVRYYNDGLLIYLKNNINEDENKKQMRLDVISLVEKYGERIITLVENIRSRLLTKLTQHPIEFKSLTFSSCNEIKNRILDWNTTRNTEHNAFITIGGQKTDDGKLEIPVKHSKYHHGNINDYDKEPNSKGQKTISYTCQLLKNKVRFVLTRKCEEKQITNKYEYYGVDVNVKHNLFSSSDGQEIDYDRDLFNDYLKFIKKLDSKLQKKTKEERILSNKDESSKKKWMNRIKDLLKRKSSQLVKQAKEQGKDHIVMEELELMGKSYIRSQDLLGFKYSRLIRLLNLADLKHIVTSIANKNGLQVTFVQPHYTSQTCSCGNVSKENRKTQEIFKCISCGSTENADTHSAKNIEDRLRVDVLRRKLLNFSNGLYSTKRIKKDTIKSILAECYDTQSSDIKQT